MITSDFCQRKNSRPLSTDSSQAEHCSITELGEHSRVQKVDVAMDCEQSTRTKG